jgi:hypothetical protein
MTVYYDEGRHSWEFVIDLPRGVDGKRKQMRRRGFKTERIALKEESDARKQFCKAELAADGSVCAELTEPAHRDLDGPCFVGLQAQPDGAAFPSNTRPARATARCSNVPSKTRVRRW